MKAFTLQQIYDALGKIEDGGAEMVLSLQEAISKTRNEAAASRIDKNKVLDALGLRDDNQKGELDSTLQNLSETLAALKKVGEPEKLGKQISSLQTQLKELSDKYEASEKKVAEEREMRVKSNIAAELTSALSAGKAVDTKMFTKLLADNVTVSDDGSFVYHEGDKEVSIADGVKNWLAANAWAVKNDSSSGAGTKPQGGSKGNGKITMDELAKMSREEINANWDKISKGVES